MARTARRPDRNSAERSALAKLRLAHSRPVKADAAARRLAKSIDGMAPLVLRVADLEQQVATLNARTVRLAHAITAVRALYVEGARALDI